MGHTNLIRVSAGTLALLVATLGVAPSAAWAYPCYYSYSEPSPPSEYPDDSESPSYPEPSSDTYSETPECDAAGSGITAVGSLLAGIGDALVGQQINFGGFANFITPTGKLRHTSHDGLRISGTNDRTASFDVDEGSVFANGSYDLPGTYFGGKVRVSALAGYDRLVQDADNNSFKNEIDAFIYGGSYLWTQGSFYSMSLIIGVSGEADGSAGAADFDYDVSGYFTNSLIGYTFDLSGGWKFDLRGNIGHYDVDTSRFTVTAGGRIKGIAEAWNAGITGTVFTIVDVNGGVIRPYVLAAYRNVFDEDIDVRGDFSASFFQADDYGKVELGFDYVEGAVTYGAAAYTEFSSDEETIGARLGVSVKLQ